MANDERSVVVCLTGHVTEIKTYKNDRFCRAHGVRTRMACVHCGHPIHVPTKEIDLVFQPDYRPPGKCHRCGNLYPWARIDAAAGIIADKNKLDSDGRREVVAALAGMVDESPQAAGLAQKIKKLLPPAWDFVRPILTDLICASAKKILL